MIERAIVWLLIPYNNSWIVERSLRAKLLQQEDEDLKDDRSCE
jgi:hypothetical protein